jgi:hypothetical protein
VSRRVAELASERGGGGGGGGGAPPRGKTGAHHPPPATPPASARWDTGALGDPTTVRVPVAGLSRSEARRRHLCGCGLGSALPDR